MVTEITLPAQETHESIRQMIQEESATIHPQPQLYPMGLWDLNSTEYRLKIYPIQIVVEMWPENEYIAYWHDVEAVGFGEGKEEAIDDLRQCIIDLYKRLLKTEDDKLGKIPLRAKKILQKAIEKVK